MGKRVTVLPGAEAVSLPTGPDGEDQGYHAGESATLTDSQYERLAPATRRMLTVGEDVAEPDNE